MDSKLTYRSFDQLMASVETDMSNFADEGLINRGSCVKIVQRVNEDLGLKINGTKQTVIKIENHKGEIPSDLFKVSYAFICGTPVYVREPGEIYGTRTQEYNEEIPVNVLKNGNACMNSCGGCYWVTQLFREKIVRYTTLEPVRISQGSASMCEDTCPGVGATGFKYEVDFCTGEITTTLKEGNIFIHYISTMEDESGNLMIYDHPLVRPYYEYAVKKHILEGAFINGEADTIQRLQYIQMELNRPGGARDQAIMFISIIQPSELMEVMRINRNAFIRKYVIPFTADFYKYC